MKFSKLISSFPIPLCVVALAAPAQEGINLLEQRQGSSGCVAFEDPDCCIDYGVCQCANGKSLQY
ncbi:hypothetical protein VTN77DRAFT_3000 [Rasamsonia byssochlamydoides]|uniref:uncharacterized protein n=1 Tax=Rasamsonia byssochlamydoides TaxID=89139 RepID=UPI00374435A8